MTGSGLGEVPRVELEARVLTAHALLRRWLTGLQPVGDYTLRDDTLAALGEQEATPPEPLTDAEVVEFHLTHDGADLAAPQGEPEPRKWALDATEPAETRGS